MTEVSLRPWRDEDAPFLVEQAADPRLWRDAPCPFPTPFDEAAARQWIATVAREWLVSLAIEVDGAPAGGVHIGPPDDFLDGPSAGFFVRASHWRRGIASRALALLLEQAAAFGLGDLYAEAAEDNAASLRVLAKCGFRLERRRRSILAPGGEPRITCVHRHHSIHP